MSQATGIYKGGTLEKYCILPVSGAGNNIPVGTPLMAGVTGGTNYGVAIPITASSNANMLGILSDLHTYSQSGDALTQTLGYWYNDQGQTQYPPSHRVQVPDSTVLVRMSYNLANPTGATVTGYNASTHALSITSTEANLDGGYFYGFSGASIGELGFLKSSSSSIWTAISALTVNPAANDVVVKILPLFYNTPVFFINTATQSTLLDTTAAAGSGAAAVMEQHITMNALDRFMDPQVYNNSQKLNLVSSLDIWAALAFQNCIYHPT